MICIGCTAVMPFNKDEPLSFDCVYCDKKQYPDAVDLLSEPELGFAREIRPGQIALTQSVVQNMDAQSAALFEAGTGVGKSFAYLLPAILAGKRIIISTAKISLQTQLIEKDLPYIKQQLKAIGHGRQDFTFFAGYGKSRYACYKRAHDVKGPKNKNSDNKPREWAKYEKFFKASDYGRWEDARKLHLKLDESLNAEDCIGVKCKYHKDGCGYAAARREMLEAQVVVTNNWMLGYHYKLLRELEHFSLLGTFDHIMIDEAHKVEDGIRDAFSYEVSLDFAKKLETQFDELARSAANTLPDSGLLVKLQHVSEALNTELLTINTTRDKELTSKASGLMQKSMQIIDTFKTVLLSAVYLTPLFRGDAKGPQRLLRSTWVTALSDIDEDHDDSTNVVTTGYPSDPDDAYCFDTLGKILKTLKKCQVTYEDIITVPKNRTWTLEEKLGKKGKILIVKSIPVNIGMYLPDKNITYLSATLSIEGAFTDFERRLGLRNKPHMTGVFESPFNIAKQAHLYVPLPIVVPAPDAYKEGATELFRSRMSDVLYQLIYASQGDALVLFSSKEDLKYVDDYLKTQAYPYPVFAQGEFSAAEAVSLYRETPKATILGLKALWEGIDVPGKKLFLVIICKLPFPHVGDPVVKARIADCEAVTEGSGFTLVRLPDMLLDLRQGVGRLIRSKTDKGVIAILDSRLWSKNYRNTAIKALGFTKASHDLDLFLRGIATRHAGKSTD